MEGVGAWRAWGMSSKRGTHALAGRGKLVDCEDVQCMLLACDTWGCRLKAWGCTLKAEGVRLKAWGCRLEAWGCRLEA